MRQESEFRDDPKVALFVIGHFFGSEKGGYGGSPKKQWKRSIGEQARTGIEPSGTVKGVLNTYGTGRPADSCRNVSCKTLQLESCHDLRAPGRGLIDE